MGYQTPRRPLPLFKKVLMSEGPLASFAGGPYTQVEAGRAPCLPKTLMAGPVLTHMELRCLWDMKVPKHCNPHLVYAGPPSGSRWEGGTILASHTASLLGDDEALEAGRGDQRH